MIFVSCVLSAVRKEARGFLMIVAIVPILYHFFIFINTKFNKEILTDNTGGEDSQYFFGCESSQSKFEL